ncbi:MAG: NAD(P)-dependent oxidoreductase [Acidobacteriota bacterium]|nr:NAD(P)-dependent oxidoreductase [Acidobacteriota bacterium]
MSRSVVITGAGGFIGSSLCQYFSRRGYTVHGWAHTLTPDLKQALADCTIQQVDILTKPLPLLGAPVDAVIHTAKANEITSRDAGRGLMLSVLGTKNILEWAVANHAGKVIALSTFRVYGESLCGTISEESSLGPSSDYALAHLFSEQYMEMYARRNDVGCVALRIGNVFGRFAVPSVDRWSLVPACFCREAFMSGRITLKSSGRQFRNFVSLEDVGLACEAICNDHQHKFSAINVSSGPICRIVSVAKIVQEIFSSRYGTLIPIVFESHNPVTASPFSVSQEKLEAVGFVKDRTQTLQSEIEALFDELQRVKLSDSPGRLKICN